MNHDLVWWGEIALSVVALICLPYLAWKGKNQATKEDIRGITEEVESVKSDFAHLLNINSFRYQKEFEILIKLMDSIVRYKNSADAITMFLRTTDLSNNGEEYSSRMATHFSERNDFTHTIEIHKPFYPEKIYNLITSFDTAINSTFTDTLAAARSTPERYLEFISKSEAHKNDTGKFLDEITAEIRKHVKSWELTMPEINNQNEASLSPSLD